jgi:hypothetical protein
MRYLHIVDSAFERVRDIQRLETELLERETSERKMGDTPSGHELASQESSAVSH